MVKFVYEQTVFHKVSEMQQKKERNPEFMFSLPYNRKSIRFTVDSRYLELAYLE